MKGVIILEKGKERKKLSESIADTNMPAKVAQALSPINFS